MPLSDHERPLSDHERRILAEIEADFAAAAQSRHRRRRLATYYLAMLVLGAAAAAVVSIAALAALPSPVAALVTGLLGLLTVGLSVRIWNYRRGASINRVVDPPH
jgi:drug/metabolite transporter (DMT)-like permease